MEHDTQAAGRPHVPQSNGVAVPVIVVGLDGSPSSWDAFSWAAGEAARSNSRLVVVSVAPFTEATVTFAVPYGYVAVEQTRREVADELKCEATHRANELGIALTFVCEYGDTAHALTDVAGRLHADLLVVGKSEKVLHHLAGSLSRRLTSRHNAPVVVVVP